MDFDSCFAECCKGCNSTSKYRSPASGQGDCKCGGVIQEQNFWVKAGKGNALRSKTVGEKEKSELKRDSQKKLMDASCNCFTKSNKKQECKLKHEKNEPGIFENCSSTYNNFISDSWKPRMERFYASEERRCNDCSTSEKLLSENVLELEEKVNFLLRIFKDCGCKLSNEGYVESVATKAAGSFGNAWHLFNLDKRLCAAEEGIEKLALILEELVKESSRKKGFLVADESATYSEPLGFDKMTMEERINFLRNRNDMLLSLIKTFLKSSSVEEICSQLSSQPNEYAPKPASLKLHFGGKSQAKEEIMEALKNLQVISEHAELSINQNDETENIINDIQRKNGVRNLKGKYSQVSENSADNALGLCDVTSRLLAQEAMLKSSLDKVHLELLSKLDPSEKNFLKTNLNILNSIQMTPKEENNNSDFEAIFGSSSDNNCIFCENENLEKPPSNDMSHVASKYTRFDECKEPMKEERNSLGGNSNILCKDSSSKKTDEQLTGKNKFNATAVHKNSSTTLRSPQKSTRNKCCLTELCLSNRGGSMHDAQGREQRPLTAPMSHKKALPASGLKSSAPQKNASKNSGINSNVRNKNKILLSKKSFVQTS